MSALETLTPRERARLQREIDDAGLGPMELAELADAMLEAESEME